MSTFDWDAIRALYESGEGPGSIAKRKGMPSRQSIYQRAKTEGWVVIDKPDIELEVIPFDGLTPTQRLVVQYVSTGATQRIAAALVGVHETTVSDWKQDASFAKSLMAAKAVKNRKRLAKIDESPDWRAALALLERDPDSRDDWAPPNAARGMMANATFNVLGHVHLGIERDGDNRLPEERKQPAAITLSGDGQ